VGAPKTSAMQRIVYGLRNLAGHREKMLGQAVGMSSTILLIILVAVLLAVLPAWPYSRAWGAFPSGLVGLIILLLLLLMFFGMI
jgi:hypothetical protein